MSKLASALQAVRTAAPRLREPALDLVLVAGVIAVTHGVALVSVPAAWILGGLAASAAALLIQRSGKAKAA